MQVEGATRCCLIIESIIIVITAQEIGCTNRSPITVERLDYRGYRGLAVQSENDGRNVMQRTYYHAANAAHAAAGAVSAVVSAPTYTCC